MQNKQEDNVHCLNVYNISSKYILAHSICNHMFRTLRHRNCLLKLNFIVNIGQYNMEPIISILQHSTLRK